MEVSGQLHVPATLSQGKSPCYPWYRRQIDKFPGLYGTGRFNTVFTGVHHRSLSWAK